MKKNLIVILIIVAVVVIGLAGWFENRATAPAGESAAEAPQQPNSPIASNATSSNQTQVATSTNKIVKMTDGLQIQDVVVGTGAEAKAGDTVTVQYIGTLENGTKFDSSYDRNQPFIFHLGAGQVIKGWDEGVAGMKVGGKRNLTIPASLGYGASGVPGVIPPNSVLKFTVDLLDVK